MTWNNIVFQPLKPSPNEGFQSILFFLNIRQFRKLYHCLLEFQAVFDNSDTQDVSIISVRHECLTRMQAIFYQELFAAVNEYAGQKLFFFFDGVCKRVRKGGGFEPVFFHNAYAGRLEKTDEASFVSRWAPGPHGGVHQNPVAVSRVFRRDHPNLPFAEIEGSFFLSQSCGEGHFDTLADWALEDILLGMLPDEFVRVLAPRKFIDAVGNLVPERQDRVVFVIGDEDYHTAVDAYKAQGFHLEGLPFV